MVLCDLKEVKLLIQNQSVGDSYNRMIANKIAIVDIMEVLMVQNLVDIIGNVPYTEALGGLEFKAPVYDDARAIYNDLQARLSADIATLSTGAAADAIGGDDVRTLLFWDAIISTETPAPLF